MLPSCDALVWLADGLPGIVVGVAHHHVNVLWPATGRVTKIPAVLIVHSQPFQPGSQWPTT